MGRHVGLLTALATAATVVAMSACAQILGTGDFRDAEGGGGAGIGGGGSGGTAGGGASSGTENCTDGVDNNGNQLADCEDAQCAPSHQCVAEPSSDRLGIGWLYEGSSPPDCHEDYRIELYDLPALAADPALCSCACSDPTDATCWAFLRCTWTPPCDQGVNVQNALATSECSPWTLSNTLVCSMHEVQVSAESHTCDPIADISLTPPDWSPSARVCVRSDGGHCAHDGEICVPRAPLGGVGPCVALAGEVDCPTSYPERFVFGDGSVNDQRGCDVAACTCGSASGTTCACTGSPCGIEVFMGDNCAGASLGVAEVGGASCISVGQPGQRSVQIAGASIDNPGSCPPSGTAMPNGGVSPQGKITVCCADST